MDDSLGFNQNARVSRLAAVAATRGGGRIARFSLLHASPVDHCARFNLRENI